MTSVTYNDIFSFFYTKVEAFDFIDLDSEQISEFMSYWLLSASKKPYVRRLFSSFSIDQEIQEVSFELKYVVDETYDSDFVIEILALGMIVEWITPKVNSLNNMAQMFGSKEEKFYSQAAHLKQLQDLKASMQREQKNMIRDRGYLWNSYLDGES